MELFGFNPGVRPFYAARRFAELSRGSVLCLLNPSFEKGFPQRQNLIFCQGDTGRILARLRCPMASRVALDLPYWAMCSALYHLIRMAIKMASKVGPFFSFVDFMSCITIIKRPCYGLLKINTSCNIICYYVNKFSSYVMVACRQQ